MMMIIEGLKFQLQLNRLQKSRRTRMAKYQDDYADAVQAKAPREVKERLGFDNGIDIDEIDYEIDVLTTAHLLQQAQWFQIPVPDPENSEYWNESQVFGGRYLSRSGVTKVRSEIRAERKARWDYWTSHITLLIGLLGALIGVISILKK